MYYISVSENKLSHSFLTTVGVIPVLRLERNVHFYFRILNIIQSNAWSLCDRKNRQYKETRKLIASEILLSSVITSEVVFILIISYR